MNIKYVGEINNEINWSNIFKNWFEFLPSIGWICFMALPFLLQFNNFDEASRQNQEKAILLLTITIFFADFICLIIKPNKAVSSPNSFIKIFEDHKFYICVFAIIAGWHIYNLDQIPLVQKYYYNLTPDQLNVLRENSSKLLNVNSLFKYFFSIASSIFVPIGFLLLMIRKLYLKAIIFVICGLLYANITLALLPVLITTITIILTGFSIKLPNINVNPKVYYISLVVICLIAIRGGFFLVTNPYSGFNYKPTPASMENVTKFVDSDPRSKWSLPDNFRIVDKTQLTKEQHIYNYVIYRFILVPVEVSNKWYLYYPNVHGSYFGIKDLYIGGRNSDFIHPSRFIGMWAYAAKFPKEYLNTNNSYASIDADAYGRLGMVGVIISALIVFGLRVFLKVLIFDNSFSKILYFNGLVQLSILPPQASIQATLISHGLIILIGFMTIYWFVVKVNDFKQKESMC